GLLERSTQPLQHTREWGPILLEQQSLLNKREEEGSRRVGLMLQKGRKVVIEVAKAKHKVNLRGFNPNLIVQLTPNHVAYTFLMLDLDEMKLEFNGVPVVYEKLQDAFWCMLPDDVVDKALKEMTDKLKIEGRGYRLEFENM